MLSLEQLYGSSPDNLAGLTHPLWKRPFRYMTDGEAIELAERMMQRILESGRKLVVVAEAGASPLSEICQKIAQRKKHDLTFFSVKFPREPIANISHVLAHYLTDEERPSRLEQLELSCKWMPPDFFEKGPADILWLLDSLSASALSLSLHDSSGQSSEQPASFYTLISRIFKNTRIAQRLSQPFIYLDEYIDSGTTFRNAIAFFRCFVEDADLVTASYYVRPDEIKGHERVLYVDCTSGDRPGCFDGGAYPYENRVDLVGHFYRVGSDACTRTEVAAIGERFSAPEGTPREIASADAFLEALSLAVSLEKLHEHVLRQCNEVQVRNYISREHLMRYCLHAVEEKLGEPDMAEFLFQLFDMYGPAWTPMPVAFHFDFWSSFAGVKDKLYASRQFTTLTKAYQQIRGNLLYETANFCRQRRQEWLQRIDDQLEERYDHGQDVDSRKGIGSRIVQR